MAHDGDIDTKWGKAAFAGTPAPPPMPGDRIKVLRGEDLGMEAEVLDLLGHAYRPDFQVVVRNKRDKLVWYYPWDVIIIERAGGTH